MAIHVERSRLSEAGRLEAWDVTGPGAADQVHSLAWLRDNTAAIKNTAARSGGVLLRGFPWLRDAEAFDTAISQIAPVQLDYVGGTSPRSVVRRQIMTATDMPPRCSIPLHQEMAYIASPPGGVAFFCETAPVRGGQTTIADMREVTASIPAHFRTKCAEHGIQLRRTMPSPATMHLKPGVQKPWTEVFCTTDKQEAERIVAAKGWTCSWYNDETLHVSQDILPPTRTHAVTGEEVWSNFAHFFSPICMMTWALEDGRVTDYEEIARARTLNPQMLDAMMFGNGEMLPEQDCLDVFRILRQAELPLTLRPGDLIILDNLHYAHGRRAFAGERKVLVSLFNTNLH